MSAPAPAHVVVVATSYDTEMEPVEVQAESRARGLVEQFGHDPRVKRLGFIVKNDAAPQRHFTSEVQAGLLRAAPRHVANGDFVVEPLFGAKVGAWGLRGLAYIEGIDSALARGADVVITINLNLKVEIDDVKAAFMQLLQHDVDAVVGTRAATAGGRVVGAGRLGVIKSALWRTATHTALPRLQPFSDPNAPVKVFRRKAASTLVANARVAGVCPDVEWLALLVQHGCLVEEHSIVWRQRPPSRPPWRKVPRMLVDLGRLRRRFRLDTTGDTMARDDR